MNKKQKTASIVAAILLAIFCSFFVLFDSGPSVNVSLQLKTGYALNFQLFYRETSADHFAEEQSLTAHVPSMHGYQEVHFELPLETVHGLRLDFGDSQGTLEFRNVVVKKGFNKEVMDSQITTVGSHQVELERTDSGFILTSTGNDPHLVLDYIRIPESVFSEFYVSVPLFFLLAVFLSAVWYQALRKLMPYFIKHPFEKQHIPIFLVCGVLIFLPFLFRDTFDPEIEQRLPAEKPILFSSTDGVVSGFIPAYEAWFDDHFGFRSLMLRQHTKLTYQLLNEIENQQILAGQNDWLFYSASDSNGIEKYQNIHQYSPEQLRTIQTNLERLYDRAGRQEIKYVLVIAPDKETVYPEYYPPSIYKINDHSKYDQVIQHMTENSYVPVIDMRPILQEHKEEGELYHQADTHWNNYGAFLCYSEIMQHFSSFDKRIVPLAIDDFSVSITEESESFSVNADMLEIAGIPKDMFTGQLFDYTFKPKSRYSYRTTLLDGETVLTERENPNIITENEFGYHVITENANEDLPNIMVYHDSFFATVRPYLSQSFHYAQYYFNTGAIYGTGNWLGDYSDGQSPQFLVHEIVERNLDELAVPHLY